MKLILAASLSLLLSGFTACRDQSEHAKLAHIFSSTSAKHSPGLAVFAKKNGRVVFERGYGVRDLRTYAAIDPYTDFRLASFSKQFTAAVIMLLVRDSKLHYDDPLTTLLPGFPLYGQHITIRHLLTHTSGLPDYEDLMQQVEAAKGPVWSRERQIDDHEVLALLEQQSKAKFAPGSNWSYSNSGYVLLGLIAAKVSGMPFEQLLHDRIFRPLGMESTLAYVKGKNTVPRRAYGYSRNGDRFVDTDQSSTSATLGDGGIYSNLADLAKWDEALQKHTLLSIEEMVPALTPVMLADGKQPHWPLTPGEDNLDPGKPVFYGYGWFLDPYRNFTRMWHTGITSGFRTAIERFPRENTTIIVLCNSTDLDPAKLALEAADVLLPSSVGLP